MGLQLVRQRGRVMHTHGNCFASCVGPYGVRWGAQSSCRTWLSMILTACVAGCTANPAAPSDPASDVPAPIPGFRAMWKSIAEQDGLPTTEEFLWQLASQSTTSWQTIDGVGIFLVVELRYSYATPPSSPSHMAGYMRGAAGNGPYYIFLLDHNALKPVGRFEGNSCAFDTTGDQLRAIVTFHLSAYEEPEHIYLWDGHTFAPATR